MGQCSFHRVNKFQPSHEFKTVNISLYQSYINSLIFEDFSIVFFQLIFAVKDVVL